VNKHEQDNDHVYNDQYLANETGVTEADQSIVASALSLSFVFYPFSYN